ncbi:hypothetical protein [Microbacterium sp.]|uniref:hypothetical protein n=1 Tax=Microbacterium sp. TaxID=51671 RepID=UPI0039E61E4A
MSHSRPVHPTDRRPRRGAVRGTLASLATAALVAGGLAATPLAASAATAGAISDAVFTWGISKEAGGGAFFGGCNFLSAGIAGDTGSSRLWTESDGFYKTSDGNVSIVKDGPDGTTITPTWSTKCQTGAGTAVTAGNTSSTSGNAVVIGAGAGEVAADGSLEISWDGDFTIVFYGGLTYWSVSDPVLTVDAAGAGQVTATASGYGTSMEDMTQWVPIAPEQIVLANLTDVDAADGSFTVTPDYLGVEVSTSGTPQTRTGANWGAFPQSYVDFNVKTGQASYWYSSGGARDAAKPATPLSVSFDVSSGPAFTSSPASQTVTTGDAVTLTAAATGADAYQWQSSPVGSDAWNDIAGATAAAYSFTASSATALQYRVVATGGGASTTSSAATVTVDVPTPTVAVSKTTGLSAAGETVTVSGTGFLPNAPATSGSRPPLAGQFTGAYIAFASRNADGTGLANYTNGLSEYTTWAVRAENLAAIGGSGAIIAPDGTFEVQIRAEDLPLDEGKQWGIRTYAAGGANYPAFATFTPLEFAVAAGTASIPASATVGAALTAETGGWPAGATLTYQWLRHGAPISGATSPSYTPAASDAGAALSVRVSGAVPGYTTTSVTSNTVTVAAATLSAAVPTLTGTAKVGATLTAKPGTWTAGTKLTYQWLRGGSAISGATKSTYTAVAADRGKNLTVRVTGSKAGYTTVSKTSAAKTVAWGTLKSATPKFTGTAQVGKKLTAKPGTWTAGTKLTYQWLRGGSAIKGATKSTYTAVAADRGKKLTVRVTGSKAGYTTVSKTSAAKTVAWGTLKSATPKITGAAKVGKKLTAVRGSWTAGTKVTYQWFVGGKAVKGATKATYTVKKADRGKTVVVKAKGVKAGYKTVTKTSAAKRIAR